MKPGFQSVAEAAPTSQTGFAGVTDCPDLAAAVTAGYRWAQPDGIVLLSPAAPSFGAFKDYRDRAEAFARAVRALSSKDRGSELPHSGDFDPR
jgi:UDP-N-acetylmuramoylalanine-D-glutamate ligase